jgi:hypothetical protein
MHDKFCPMKGTTKTVSADCLCDLIKKVRIDEARVINSQPSLWSEPVHILDEPEKRHRSKPEGGSTQGAHDVSMRAGTQKLKLLESYLQFPEGLSSANAAIYAGISLETGYRARVSELRDQELIESVRDLQGNIVLAPGALGSDQTVDRITSKGRAVFSAVNEMRK